MIGRSALAFVLVCLVSLTSVFSGIRAADDADVPMFRGNAARTGEMPGPGPAGDPTLLWSFRTDGGAARSIRAADDVILVQSDLALQVLDAATGMERWHFLPAAGGFSPTVADESVYVIEASRGVFLSRDEVFSLDLATGAQRWHTRLDVGLAFSLAVVGDRVYLPGEDSSLIALDSATGIERWRLETDAPVAIPPVIEQPLAIFSSLDGRIYAVDAVTGEARWTFTAVGDLRSLPVAENETAETGGGFWSSPVAANGTIYAGSSDGNVYAIDGATGEERWRFDTGDEVGPSPVVADGVVYVGHGPRITVPSDGGVFALDAATGAERWHFVTPNVVPVTPLVTAEAVFVVDHAGNLSALDPATGAERWFVVLSNQVETPPAFVDGVIYVRGSAVSTGSEMVSGTLHAVDAAKGTEIWRSVSLPGEQIEFSPRWSAE
jgi:outer membrane protein assembly factor BamB